MTESADVPLRPTATALPDAPAVPGFDFGSLLAALAGGRPGGPDSAALQQAVTVLSATNQQLLLLLREERQERNELRRKVEKLEAAIKQLETARSLTPAVPIDLTPVITCGDNGAAT